MARLTVERPGESVPHPPRLPVSGGAKINELGVALPIQDDVLVLDVAVDDPLSVEKSQAIGYLAEERADLERRETRRSRLDVVEEVLTNAEARHHLEKYQSAWVASGY